MKVSTHSTVDSLSLRAAARWDWHAISALLLDAQLPQEGAKASLSGFVIALDEEDAVLGCVCIEQYGMMCLLRSIAVAAHSRGSGTGRALMGEALRRIDAAGYASTILLTTSAAPIFLHYGFRKILRGATPDEVKQSVEFTHACPISATVMRRDRPKRIQKQTVTATFTSDDSSDPVIT